MAVVIGSALDKDIAGNPLFRGVSFKLERRDRMTLAGRNGAGKTTLLRMLVRRDRRSTAASSCSRRARAWPCTTSGRRASATSRCATTCCRAVASSWRSRRSCARPGGRDGRAARRPALLDRYARAQARLEHAGGWNWRARALGPLHGLGFARRAARPQALRASRAASSPAPRWRARSRATRTCCCSTSPPTTSTSPRSSGSRSYLTGLDAAVVLVAHDRWFLEAVGTSVLELEAGRARFFPGSWHAWRREAAAREIQLGKQIEKQQAEIARMERFIERFRYKATKARQAQSRVKKLEKMDRIERDPRDNRSLGFSSAPTERTGRVVLDARGRAARGARPDAARGRRAVARARRARVARGPERRRQDDADRGAGRPPRARRRAASHRPQRAARLPVPARRGARLHRHRAGGRPARHRPHARRRRARCSAASCSAGEEAEKPMEGCRAASAGGCRSRSSCRRARTCWSSTSRPTTSTSTRARRSRTRSAASAARAAGVARPRAAGRGRHPDGRDGGRRGCAATRAAGRSTARLREERREEERARPGARSGRRRRPRPRRRSQAATAAQSPPARRRTRRRAAELEREVERAEAALRAIEDELADPSGWAQPDEQRTREGAPRGGEEGGRGGLRALGGAPRPSRGERRP